MPALAFGAETLNRWTLAVQMETFAARLRSKFSPSVPRSIQAETGWNRLSPRIVIAGLAVDLVLAVSARTFSAEAV